MNDNPQAAAAEDASQGPGWQQALEELERSLGDASRAIVLLRRGLEGGGPAAGPAAAASQDTATPAPPPEPTAPAEAGAGRDAFERLWDRIDRERMEKEEKSSAEPSSPPQGLDLLPQQYLMTVEDRESKVDLVPLHRALLGLAEMEDVSLVSFANGVPVISLRSAGELDLERLGEAISTAMDRHCEVTPHGTGRLHLRLKAQQD
jgi:hypothetical protein